MTLAAKWHIPRAVELPTPGDADGSSTLIAWIDEDDPYAVELSVVRTHLHIIDGAVCTREETVFRASVPTKAIEDLAAAAGRMRDRQEAGA